MGLEQINNENLLLSVTIRFGCFFVVVRLIIARFSEQLFIFRPKFNYTNKYGKHYLLCLENNINIGDASTAVLGVTNISKRCIELHWILDCKHIYY